MTRIPTPTHDDEGNELLSDADFNRIVHMTREEFARLPPEVQEAFRHTSGWHFGQRQKVHVATVRIGGIPISQMNLPREVAPPDDHKMSWDYEPEKE